MRDKEYSLDETASGMAAKKKENRGLLWLGFWRLLFYGDHAHQLSIRPLDFPRRTTARPEIKSWPSSDFRLV